MNGTGHCGPAATADTIVHMERPDSEIYKVLFDLSQSIAGHTDLETLADSLGASLKSVVSFDSLGVMLHDPLHDTLRLHAISSKRPFDGREVVLPAAGDHAGAWVWREQKPLVMSPVTGEPHWPEPVQSAIARDIRALILVPLSNGDRRLGLLGFGFSQEYSPDEAALDFLLRVASGGYASDLLLAGSAALLQDGTEGVLVDTGPGDAPIVRELRQAGVRHLRAVILSHPAADHVGGAAAVLRAFPTDLLLDGSLRGTGGDERALRVVAHARRIPVVAPRRGQRLQFGRVSLVIRWPTAAAARGPGDPNDYAAVVDARVGALHALLPADAESNVLLGAAPARVDVLVVSHHGSSDPGLPSLLRHLHPQLAVISVGARNTYGHPSPSTLVALRPVPRVERTDRDGTIDLRGAAGGAGSTARGAGVGASTAVIVRSEH